MKPEYVQTYQAKTIKPGEPMAIKSPDGPGWELHSWQIDTNDEGWLILVWVRPKVDR